MTNEAPRRPPDDEVDGEEGWERESDEPFVRGVTAIQYSDDESRWATSSGPAWAGWNVTVTAMEFVREEPLERQLRARMAAALRAVPGVTDVCENDREIWAVEGTASGEALTQAAADVVDALADDIRRYAPPGTWGEF